MVIVLVGASAHCVRRHPAVHHIISQPRPAQQTWSRAGKKRGKQRQAFSHSHLTDEQTFTQIQSRGSNILAQFLPRNVCQWRPASTWESIHSICARAATTGVLNSKPGLTHASLPTSYLLFSWNSTYNLMKKKDIMSLV